MTIRPATSDDIPLVLPMVDRVGDFHQTICPQKYSFRDRPSSMYANWLSRQIADDRAVFLVAQREPGLLAGFLIGTVEKEIPIYRVREFGFIHDLWVEETYRNEGVGRQLVTLAIESFKRIGVKQIRLDTVVENRGAQGLFGACGFLPSTTEMILELEPV